jgi:hypothetical protein
LYQDINQAYAKPPILKTAARSLFKPAAPPTEFSQDQDRNTAGSTGNRWTAASINVMMQIYTASPNAYRVLKELGILKVGISKQNNIKMSYPTNNRAAHSHHV